MGGNIFKDYASPISRQHIRPTLQQYMTHLGIVFPRKAHVFRNFYPVGSAGTKEISGDLDLAIDFEHFFDGEPFNEDEIRDYRINYDEWEALHKKFSSRARTSTEEMCKWKAFLKLLAYPIVNEGIVHVANEKTTNGNLFTMFPQFDQYGQLSQYVQVDWMVGNLPWLKFAYHSAERGELKGMHRTQLLVATFATQGYTFLHTKGVKHKATNVFVATTPDEALDLLSGLFAPIEIEDTHTYENLHSFLERHTSKEDYSNIIKSYRRILTISKAKIPSNLEKE